MRVHAQHAARALFSSVLPRPTGADARDHAGISDERVEAFFKLPPDRQRRPLPRAQVSIEPERKRRHEPVGAPSARARPAWPILEHVTEVEAQDPSFTGEPARVRGTLAQTSADDQRGTRPFFRCSCHAPPTGRTRADHARARLLQDSLHALVPHGPCRASPASCSSISILRALQASRSSNILRRRHACRAARDFTIGRTPARGRPTAPAARGTQRPKRESSLLQVPNLNIIPPTRSRTQSCQREPRRIEERRQ